MRITITGSRSVGKSTIASLLARRVQLPYCSSDEIGEKAMRRHGGLDAAIKSGVIKKFIKGSAYSLIRDVYKKHRFVFDVSGGAVSSIEFPEASEKVRKTAKRRSIVIGLLPARSMRESVALLARREATRKHFLHLSKNEVLKKTRRHFKKLPPLFKKFCDKIIYTKGKTPEEIAAEIIAFLREKQGLSFSDIKKHYAKKDAMHKWAHILRIREHAKKIIRKGSPALDKSKLEFLIHYHGLKDYVKKNQGKFIPGDVQSLLRHTKHPRTPEEKIVHDANLLDNLGKRGIRKALFVGKLKGRTKEETHAYLKRALKKVKFYTKQGEEIGKRELAEMREALS